MQRARSKFCFGVFLRLLSFLREGGRQRQERFVSFSSAASPPPFFQQGPWGFFSLNRVVAPSLHSRLEQTFFFFRLFEQERKNRENKKTDIFFFLKIKTHKKNRLPATPRPSRQSSPTPAPSAPTSRWRPSARASAPRSPAGAPTRQRPRPRA